MSYGMDGWNKPDGDLISRAEAIDDLHGKDPSQIWDTADIEVWVNALPSAQPDTSYSDGYADGYKQGLKDAQPKRKRGKWIPVTNGRGGHECSLCHTYAPSFKSGNEWLTDYCGNCGAEMGVSEK